MVLVVKVMLSAGEKGFRFYLLLALISFFIPRLDQETRHLKSHQYRHKYHRVSFAIGMRPVEGIAPFPPASMGPPAIVYGDKRPPISNRTLGSLIDEQSDIHGSKTAVDFSLQAVQRTFHQLSQVSKALAVSLLSVGLCHGDRVGIMAGNRHEFLEVFMAAARIGCPVVLLQPGFSPEELRAAVLMSGAWRLGFTTWIQTWACLTKLTGWLSTGTGCNILFIVSRIGFKRALQQYINTVPFAPHADSQLQQIICEGDRHDLGESTGVSSYKDFFQLSIGDYSILEPAQRAVQAEDILCLAFTSGRPAHDPLPSDA